MATFNELAGTSDYQRQSWRDSYNGGRAAGDFTGNVNRSLNDERERFNGATISGSSTQMGALEYAQFLGRGGGGGSVAHGVQYSGHTSAVGSGPGAGTVTTPGYTAQVPASGTQPGAPGAQDLPKTTRIMVGGRYLTLDTKWSDGADGEDRWGDVGGSIYGLGVMINDGWSVGADFVSKSTAAGKASLAKKEAERKRNNEQYGGNRPIDLLGNLFNAADEAAANALDYHAKSLGNWMWGDSGGGW